MMISVIIPVYNVSQYVDECIQSVVGQSYRDIEVILINDGSQDDSGEKCKKWVEKDGRIRLINKENEGQAACRNLGVSIAQGELITFVDSDDWIDKDMLQKLYDALIKYDADISMCEAYTQHSNGSFSGFSLQRFDKPVIYMQEEKEFLLTVRYTMWSKLYRKHVFTRNNIVEPNIKFEDFATIPIVYALSDKIACVDECLYYYRYRKTSTVNDVKYVGERLRALEHMMYNFYQRNLQNEWSEILRRIYTERGIVLMRQIYPLLNKTFQYYCEEYDRQMKQHFGVGLSSLSPRFQVQCKSGNVIANMLGEYNLAVFGSYNLMIVAKIIMNIGMPDFLENHYCFSSLISVFSQTDDLFCELNIEHESRFRCKHLIQDFTKYFAHRNCIEFKDVDFFVIDFLEERFNIGEINGRYFTISDAFMDICENLDFEYRVIDKFSDEAKNLWKKSCLKFIRVLRRYVDSKKIILVKSFLAEGYGNDNAFRCYYDNVDEIQKVNKLLNEYYVFFAENMPEAMVIDTNDIYCYYTDEKYRHGCYPWHLNNRAYWILRTRILNEIKQFDGNEIDLKLKRDYVEGYAEKNGYNNLLKGKSIVIWNNEYESTNSLCTVLSYLLKITNKTPRFLVTDQNVSEKEVCGIKVVSCDILQHNVDNYYVVIASKCNKLNVEKVLEQYGYRRGIDFCAEEQLGELLGKE